MDNNSPTKNKNQVSFNEPTVEKGFINGFPSPEDLQRKKKRILIVFSVLFLLINTVISIVFISWMIAGKKASQRHVSQAKIEVETTEFSSDSGTEKDPSKPHLDEDSEEPASPEEPVSPPEKIRPKVRQKTTTVTLDTESLSTFESSFFEMFNTCPQIIEKERCLFAFMIIHVYCAPTRQGLTLWDGYGPSEFISKFADMISAPEFAMLPADELPDAARQRKDGELRRLADRIKQKITQNRKMRKDDPDFIPYTFHFEIFTLVKNNPEFKSYLRKAINRFEKKYSSN